MANDTIQDFFSYLEEILAQVKVKEIKNIDSAADLVAESCGKGGHFFVFGTGHSHLMAEEIYLRAGGLAYVKAILPPELMLHEIPNKSTLLERLSGYAKSLLDLYNVGSDDTLMVISNSGRNNVPVEMCLEMKKRGGNVIVLTSLQHSQKVSSRHESGKKIYELADVVIDNHAPIGDANYKIMDIAAGVGPVSDFTGVAIMQTLIVAVVEKLRDRKIEVPVFKSSNLDGADMHNKNLFDRFYSSWK